TRSKRDWSSDVCSSDLYHIEIKELRHQVTAWEIVTAKEIYLSNEEYYANQVDFYTELDIKEYSSRLLHERDHYTIKIPKITLAEIGRASCREREKIMTV